MVTKDTTIRWDEDESWNNNNLVLFAPEADWEAARKQVERLQQTIYATPDRAARRPRTSEAPLATSIFSKLGTTPATKTIKICVDGLEGPSTPNASTSTSTIRPSPKPSGIQKAAIAFVSNHEIRPSRLSSPGYRICRCTFCLSATPKPCPCT